MNISRKVLLSILLYVFFSVIIIAFTGYFVVSRKIKSSTEEQLLNKQQVIARAEASNTTIFFERIGDGVATLAQLKDIENNSPNAQASLDLFIKQRQDTGYVSGVLLTDKNGKSILNSNVLGTKDVSNQVSDRNYFIWARDQAKEGEYYVSEPVISRSGASKGEPIVVVASPIYKNEKFNGVIATAIKLDPLVNRFIELMKVSDQSQAYLINQDGNLIYNKNNPNSIDTDISKFITEDNSFTDKITKAAEKNQDGQFSTKKHLVAYSPINIPGQKWLLVITLPTDEVQKGTQQIFIRQLSMVTLVTLTLLLIGLLSARKNRLY